MSFRVGQQRCNGSNPFRLSMWHIQLVSESTCACKNKDKDISTYTYTHMHTWHTYNTCPPIFCKHNGICITSGLHAKSFGLHAETNPHEKMTFGVRKRAPWRSRLDKNIKNDKTKKKQSKLSQNYFSKGGRRMAGGFKYTLKH